MPAVATNGAGKCTAVAPDVCKTPSPGGPVPIPYPNIALLVQTKGSTASSKVLILGKKTVTKGTEIAMSSGDEGGTAGGGVKSNKFKGPAKCKHGSSKVKVQGKGVAYHTGLWGHNGVANDNAPPGANDTQSQNKVEAAA
jgi:hypothetical protein